MDDQELSTAWTALEPTALQLRRIDARLTAWLDAHDTSLAAEWLRFFRLEPLAALGLAAASAVSIVAAPPLVWFARALI